MNPLSQRNSAKGIRVSQRRPLACIECTRRKVKCDKNIPCSRCQKLHIDCTRETVQVSHSISKHRDELQYLKQLLGSLSIGGAAAVPSALESLQRRIALLEHGDSQVAVNELPLGGQVEGREAGSPLGASGSNHGIQDSLEDSQPAQVDKQKDTATMVTILEYLAWGRHYGACYPHRSCSCHARRSLSELISVNSDTTTRTSICSPLLPHNPNVLPSAEVASRMVNFHISQVAWHHNSIHSPTFLEQCEGYWATGTCDHPLWMALYCSVLSSSAWCAQNSKKSQALLQIELDEDLSGDLFRAMIDVLYAGNFLEHLSLYSVQAIVISTEVAHNLGLSDLNATLSSAAIRIAQCLGLHKIMNSPNPDIQTAQQWHETLERELGKRVWWQLVIQDHFAIPFTDTYSINPAHFSTSLPMNCHDHELLDRDIDTPTISSYTRTLAQMAQLMPGLIDDLGPSRARGSLHEQYQHIINVDQRMRQLVSRIPSFLLRETFKESEWVPWLEIARRSLAITAADKIIMIHRPFLFLSFQSPIYIYTRQTCISAAMTILREHEKITKSEAISIWTHSAFCVTATVVLCLEILYLQNNDDKTLMYKELVVLAKQRLRQRRGDRMADRGVKLIETILSEKERSSMRKNFTTIDFHKVLANFLELDHNPASTSPNSGTGFGEFNTNEDFDIWFNQIFGHAGDINVELDNAGSWM